MRPFLNSRNYRRQRLLTFAGIGMSCTASALTSITATCKRLGIDSIEYMRDVIHRLTLIPTTASSWNLLRGNRGEYLQVTRTEQRETGDRLIHRYPDMT